MMNNSLEKVLLESEIMEDPTFFPEFHLESTGSTSDTMKRKLDQSELGENLYQEFYSGLQPSDSASKSEYSITFSGSNKMKAQKPRNCSPELDVVNWVDSFMAGGHQGNKWKDKLTTVPLPHHIVLERKRRQDLNQRFSALASVVPGITKKDKASILGETVKYMAELQEHIEKLEERNKKKVTESVVFVKRSTNSDELPNDYCCSSTQSECDDQLSRKNNKPYKCPEIEAKVLERSVLVRLHCGKHKGVLPRLLNEMVRLHLIVVTTNVLPFGNDAVDITVIAQMGADFCMKTKDIVEHLRLALPI